MFPLGDTTKDQVRKEAAERGLAVADKPDSHDVCFIADGDTRAFLRGQLGSAPGQIVDTAGTVVGTPRRQLRLHHRPAQGPRHRPAGRRRPAAVRARASSRYRGPSPSARPRHSTCARSRPARPVWSGCVPPAGPVDCLVQLRAHGEVHPAVCEPGRRLGADHPARACPRHRQRPGRGLLRWRRRPRQRHHHQRGMNRLAA